MSLNPDVPRKIAVVYKSKYGSSKRYAQWIAGETGAGLYEVSQATIEKLSQCKTIVYLGGVYAVGILGVKFIKKNFKKLEGKKIIIVAVGAAVPNEKNIDNILSKNFTQAMREKIHFFMLRGAFDFRKLTLKDKVLMTLLRIMLKMKKKDNLDAEARAILQMHEKPADWTDKKTITPVIECAKN